MKKRLLYGSGVVALTILVTLVIWQGSFTFGDYGPANPTQTFLYWAVSTLVFLLTVTLGFILFRTGVKLYIERRTNREGSRIKTKLVIGALALSFMPVFFLVVWSVYVLNRNLDKWFSQPAERIKFNLEDVQKALERETREKVRAQASVLASLPETRDYLETGVPRGNFFEPFCRENDIVSAHFEKSNGTSVRICGPPGNADEGVEVEARIRLDGSAEDELVVTALMPIDLAETQGEIQSYVSAYDQLALNRKSARSFYLQLLFLLTLFILFVATWIALFLARQISIPISGLLAASGEVRKGNLGHRIQVQAVDELATLVRSFNEMTEALEANRRELESRRRFTEAILESIPTGVISLSSDGRILKVNGALKQIFPEERVTRAGRLEDLFSREDTAEIKYMMKRARRTGVASSQMDLQTERQTLHLAVTVSALETKLTSGFVLVLEDTSELLRAQRAAAWREVARRIAHEVKNPLTPITLSAQRIGRQLERISISPETEEIVRECTVTIAQEAESLKTLLDEFSQFARFPAAQPTAADLNEVVENALGIFGGRLDGIELHKELASDLPPVSIDREQFKRVVANLVDNAAESMQDSLVKKLYVATQAASLDTVELVIADTGCGISAEDKEKLFLPYFSTKGRGTGLGLAIVNHILSDHNAHIRVEDNLPIGVKFIVEIRALTAGETEARPAEARA
jgi:PAS domain S-box-containing protein